MGRPASCPYSAQHVAQRLIEHRADALIIDKLDEDGFDGKVREHLVDSRRNRVFQEMARTAAVARIARLSQELGAELMILKGVALAASYYDEPHQRPSSDIDIFVPRPVFEDVVSELTSIGYTIIPTLGGALVTHALSLEAPDGGPRLDLHRRISVRPQVSVALGFEKLDERSYPMPGHEGLRIPDAIDLLCHAALHVLGHHGDQEFMLIHAWDVVLLLNHLGGYPQQLVTKRVGDKLAEGIGWYCKWVVETFELDIPMREYQRPDIGSWRTDFAWYNWYNKARLVRQLALPSPSYMRSTGRSATPVGYASRILKGLKTR